MDHDYKAADEAFTGLIGVGIPLNDGRQNGSVYRQEGKYIYDHFCAALTDAVVIDAPIEPYDRDTPFWEEQIRLGKQRKPDAPEGLDEAIKSVEENSSADDPELIWEDIDNLRKVIQAARRYKEMTDGK